MTTATIIQQLIDANPLRFWISCLIIFLILLEVFYIFLLNIEKKSKYNSWMEHSMSLKFVALMLTILLLFLIWAILIAWREILVFGGAVFGLGLFFYINYRIAKGIGKEETPEEFKKRKGCKFLDGEKVRIKKNQKLGKEYGSGCEFDEDKKEYEGKIVTIDRHAKDDGDSDFKIMEGDDLWFAEENAEPINKRAKK